MWPAGAGRPGCEEPTPMRTYVIRRLLLLPVTVILLSIFAFGLVRLVPGSVVDAAPEQHHGRLGGR